MASMDPEQKIKFLLCVLKNTEGLPNMQAIAADRNDKAGNVTYHFKAIAKASGQYIVERNRVVAVDDAVSPANHTGTKKKASTTTTKKVEKASTPDAKKTVEPTTPQSDDSSAPNVEEPVTPKSAEAEEAYDNDAEEAATPTTPKTPGSITSKKRGRAKKGANDADGTPKSATKKPRKTKKQKGAEEMAKEIEEVTKDDDDDAIAEEVEAKEEGDDV